VAAQKIVISGKACWSSGRTRLERLAENEGHRRAGGEGRKIDRIPPQWWMALNMDKPGRLDGVCNTRCDRHTGPFIAIFVDENMALDDDLGEAGTFQWNGFQSTKFQTPCRAAGPRTGFRERSGPVNGGNESSRSAPITKTQRRGSAFDFHRA